MTTNRYVAVAVLVAVVAAAGGYLARNALPPLAELPPDGLALYQALLTQIPEVVSEVPCACCNKTLRWCYEGGCPPT